MPRRVSEDLLHAYRRTSFFAETPQGRLRLRIGSPNHELDQLLYSLGIQTWAFVTAFNPGSALLPDGENGRRHLLLEDRVRQLGLRAFPAEGLGDDGKWP